MDTIEFESPKGKDMLTLNQKPSQKRKRKTNPWFR